MEADSANQGGGVPIAGLAPAADHRPVLVIAGPGQFDHTIALVLAQLLERSGMQAQLQPHVAVSPLHIARLDTTGVNIVYLSCLHLGHNPTFLRYSVRRLRRRIPSAKIVACLWGSEGKDISEPDVLAVRRGLGLLANPSRAPKGPCLASSSWTNVLGLGGRGRAGFRLGS
jgi:hypothetical protein